LPPVLTTIKNPNETPRRSRVSAYEQLYQTVLSLASEEGTICERLAFAYARYLKPMDIDAFPPNMRSKLEKVMAELNAIVERGKIEDMEQHAAVTLALRIIVIYDGSIP
jgi:hypothetical protein